MYNTGGRVQESAGSRQGRLCGLGGSGRSTKGRDSHSACLPPLPDWGGYVDSNPDNLASNNTDGTASFPTTPFSGRGWRWTLFRRGKSVVRYACAGDRRGKLDGRCGRLAGRQANLRREAAGTLSWKRPRPPAGFMVTVGLRQARHARLAESTTMLGVQAILGAALRFPAPKPGTELSGCVAAWGVRFLQRGSGRRVGGRRRGGDDARRRLVGPGGSRQTGEHQRRNQPTAFQRHSALLFRDFLRPRRENIGSGEAA